MPDSFTYVHTAFHALLRAHQSVASLPCYYAGANGVDVFDFFQFSHRTKKPNLPALAERMQKEKTGHFLSQLLKLSLTPQQQSYTMGFLTHYTTNCTLNPYISAMGDAGFFKGKIGRFTFEAAIDSALFYQNYRTRSVPLYAATPMLLNEDLAQVSKLLHDAILATYNEDIDSVHFADAFHENVRVRKKMYSPHGVRRMISKLTFPCICGKKMAAETVARIQPGNALPSLPEKWKNPYSLQEEHHSFDEMMSSAQNEAALSIAKAMQYWIGEMEEEQLVLSFGNNNYHTGLPISENTPSKEISSSTPAPSSNEKLEKETVQEVATPPKSAPAVSSAAHNTAPTGPVSPALGTTSFRPIVELSLDTDNETE